VVRSPLRNALLASLCLGMGARAHAQPPARAGSRAERAVGWALVGLGGAAAGLGMFHFGLLLDRVNTAQAHCEPSVGCDAIGADARRQQVPLERGTFILLLSGGALAGVGGYLLHDGTAVVPTPIAGGGALMVAGHF
jgi:hypothetical protein